MGRRLNIFYRDRMGLDEIQPEMVKARTSQTSRTIATGSLFMNEFLKVGNFEVPVVGHAEDFVSISILLVYIFANYLSYSIIS